MRKSKPNVKTLQAHLKLIAEMYTKQHERFKAAAFSKVASQLNRFKELDFGLMGELETDIEGVGEAIQAVIEQFYKTGTSEKFKKLSALVGTPDEPVRHDALLVRTVIRGLFRPLSIRCIDWGFAGSMRRELDTVKDVDIIICIAHKKERAVVDRILLEAGLKADVRAGEEKLGVTLTLPHGARITMDINFCTPGNRGAMYLYLTGPKTFNISMRQKAKDMGYTLNQHGLFYGNGRFEGMKEEDIFKALGMPYFAPRDRY